LVYLLVVASLLLVLGIVALTKITLVAKKGRARPDNKHNENDQEVDPWEEAGKRGGSDTHEPQ
jgi:hypothetical protein